MSSVPLPGTDRDGNGTPKATKKKDAFALLMSSSSSSSPTKRKRMSSPNGKSTSTSSSKKRPRGDSASKFVLCPAGCGKHILPHLINQHLDQCVTLSSNTADCDSISTEQQQQQQHDDQNATRGIEGGGGGEEEEEQQRKKQSPLPSPPPPSKVSDTTSHMTTDDNHFIENNLQPSQETHMSKTNDEDNNAHVAQPLSTTVVDSSPLEHNEPPEEETEGGESKKNAQIESSPNVVTNNIFARMMQQSAEESKQRSSNNILVQRIHLHDDLRVSVTCYNSNNNKNDGRTLSKHTNIPLEDDYVGRIVWSASVQVKTSTGPTGLSTSPPVQLIISSSIPSSSSSSSSSSYDHNNNSQSYRWVQRHSRLSVPVLKSILQKSIRRRKPLPSVRVAMELADKSLSDLLRRLVIIAIEDSTVHPDIPLMVWLMIATSKDFDIITMTTSMEQSQNDDGDSILKLWKRIFMFVFELSSCRWKDPLDGRNVKVENVNDNVMSSIASFHTNFNNIKNEAGVSPSDLCTDHGSSSMDQQQPLHHQPQSSEQHHRLSRNDMLIWSILMRSHYGGMKGDIVMLQDAAKIWYNRFNSVTRNNNTTDQNTMTNNNIEYVQNVGILPSNVRDRIINASISSLSYQSNGEEVQTPTSQSPELLTWDQVPTFIHSTSSKISYDRITNLLEGGSAYDGGGESRSDSRRPSMKGLFYLTMNDVTTEGVDFHCSNILESTILKDTTFVMECCERLEAMQLPSTIPPLPVASTGVSARRSWLEGILKSLMWRYSAGQNFRQPLYVDDNGDIDHSKRQKDNIELKTFWESQIRPRTKPFAESYVKNRLAN